MSGVYYNEFDPHAAQWLRNLIAAGLLPAGDVDERDIRNVAADELQGYAQVHLFAGIGGWPFGLRLAGWPDDKPIWTGSPPCQPFSNAGRRQGQADPRHLWPEFYRLVRARRPARVMGEQVAAAIDWLDGVAADLEAADYAVRAVVVPACAIDAPHIRERIWFLADADRSERRTPAQGRHDDDGADAGRQETPSRYQLYRAGDVDDADGERAPLLAERAASAPESVGRTLAGGASFWRDAGWLVCGDRKARRVKSGIRLLVDGLSGRVPVRRPQEQTGAAFPEAEIWINRVGALRAFGNGVVPQLVAEMAGAYLDMEEDEAA